jgi:hypothetical protein
MANNVSIIFETNASSVAKSIADMNAEINKLKNSSRGGARQSGTQTRETLNNAFKAANRPDLSRQSGLNAVRSSTRRGLTEQLEISTMVAADMLKRTKGAGKLVAELNEGVGYAIDEGFRPLREASAMLRRKAEATKSKKSQAKYLNAADEIDTYVNQYQKLLPGQKAAKRAFKEADALTALEKAQTAFQKIGVEVGSAADLTKFANRISQISPAIAHSVKSLRDSMDKISPQEYMQRLAEISMRGVSTLTSQKDAFTKQISTATTGAAGKGGAYRKIFEKRFGDVDAMMASGKQFEFKDIADQTAFSTWKDSLRKGLGSYITTQLDPKSIKQLTQLGEAKKTGDTEQIQQAMTAAEKAVKGRLSRMYEQLAKLEDIAKTTKDRDLNNIVSKFKQQVSAQAQVLNTQLADGALKTQGSMYKTLESGLASFTTRANTFRGSKTQRTKDNLGAYINQLDENAYQLISDQIEGFKKIKFKSLGKKTMEEAGITKPVQNMLNTQILGPTGFFKAGSQEDRLNSLSMAVDRVRPSLEGMGLKGKELEQAEAHLTKVLNALASQYREAANQTQGVNARASQSKRAKALELIARGQYDEARAMVADLEGYASTNVNKGRPSKKRGGGIGGGNAASVAELDVQAQSDREQNMSAVEAAITKRQNNPNNTFMGRLRQVSAFAGSLLNVYGLVASAVGTVVNGVNNLITQANELDKVASTVNALGGSFNNFSNSLQVAVKQQATYGGTLQETFQGLTSLVPLTKRYGADLGQLDNIARRLAVVDPLQGFQGAAIALKEFFSGDITSLSRRFEIDRKSLNSIKAAGTQLEQLQALDKALSDMGISNDVLAAKTQTAAVQFDRAAASWSNFTTLAGKGLQGRFIGVAEVINYAFSDSARSLATLEEREQFFIDSQRQIGRVAAQFKDFGEEVQAVSDVTDQFTSGPFFDFNSLKVQQKNYGALIDEFNGLIEKLNEVRAMENLPALSYFSKDDAEIIKELTVLSSKTDIPVKVLLESRDATGRQRTVEGAIQEATARTPLFANVLEGLSFGLYRSEGLQDLNTIAETTNGAGYYGPEASGALFPRNFNNQNYQASGNDQLLMQTGDANIRRSSLVLVQAIAQQTDDINSLTDLQYIKQSEDLLAESNINYSETVRKLRAELQSGMLTQEESDNVLMQLIAVNKKLLTARQRASDIEDSYITNMMKDISAFGSTTAKDSILKKVDDLTQKQAEMGQGILARMYGQAGGGAELDPSNRRVKEIVDFAKEKYNVDRETLYYMNEMEKKQAQMTVTANQTVSAYTALTNLTSGLNISLQDAVSYAMDFKNQMTSFTSGAVFGQLSLQDRLSVTSSSLSNIGKVGGPQNMNEAFNALNTMASLRQEQANAATSAGDSSKKILEKYEKEKTKIAQDGSDERTRIMEDWKEATEKLIRESEYEKRAATADFYEAMFQNDNLTLEQQQAFSARREAIRSEADAVRSTDPAKAKLIMDAGEQQIRNEMDAAEKVAKYQKDNLEIDEEIGDLQRDLAKAKDEDDRRSIQRKIDKLNQQKLENQREIDQVNAVQKARAEADAQKLKDAREGISEEQKARDKAIQDSKDKELKALSDLKIQKDADLKEEAESKAKVSQAQILSLQDYQKLEAVGNIMTTAAGMAAAGTPSDQVTAYLNKNLGDVKKYFSDRGTPMSKDILTFLEGQQNLVGSAGANPALQAMATFLGLSPNKNLPTEPGSVQTFVPFDKKKSTSISGENTPEPAGSAVVPEALDTNSQAVNNNTIEISLLNQRVKALSDNLFYYTFRRTGG